MNDRLLAHRNGSLGSIITIFAGVPRKRPLPVVQMESGALGIFPVKRGSQLGENLIEWPHMGEMDLGAWFHAVFGHWQNWLSGSGIGGVITIAVGVLSSLKLWTMPRKWYAITFIGFFFIGANYMAWHDAYSSMKGRESDLRQSRVELWSGSRVAARHAGRALAASPIARSRAPALKYVKGSLPLTP